MNDAALIKDYKNDPQSRKQFYNFVADVFPSADFREWQKKGYWPDEFIPFSLLKDGMIISNVCTSKMKLLIDGELVKGIQIGAVGTLPEYRNSGLSRYLMEHVIDEYRESADLFFLFANETVLDFYPKFGFRQHNESVYKFESALPAPNYSLRNLNIDVEADSILLERLVRNRSDLTRLFGALNYESITLWHVLNIYRDDIYYLESEDIIFIITRNNNLLNIWDIIYRDPFDMSEVLPKLIENNVTTIVYHFPPDVIDFKYDSIQKSDTLLFVKGEFKLSDFTFKFPTTAQT